MATLYPLQDSWVKGEISPRLHARASLELYRAGLAKCINFLTLPHGGIRKRGGTRFVGEVKDSAHRVRLIPFIFSADQAYCLEFGDSYIRVYAYGARVGTVEVVTPWAESEVADLQHYQSADQMWLAHPNHALHVLTRSAHATWTLETYPLEDGPFEDVNTTGTTLTPADYGSSVPPMTSNTAPSGTASASSDNSNAYKAFDRQATSKFRPDSGAGTLTYDFAGTDTRTVNAYALIALHDTAEWLEMPSVWKFEGFDGSNWVPLDTRAAETGWEAGEKRFYEFNNKTAFQAYRLNWAASSSSGTSSSTSDIGELYINQAGDEQTPFNLTASSPVGINDDAGFLATDVGRQIRLQGSDGNWRWARIVSRTSSTVVTIRLYGHALPDLSPIVNWRLGALTGDDHAGAVVIYEERLALARRFSVYLSRTGDLDDFSPGEEDDAGLSFTNAGGGQANDIVWIVDGDGYLLLATTGGVRAISGSGIDEALTPSSFKNRRSRTSGAARIAPVDAGSSFLYVTRSRRTIAELTMNQYGRFSSEDIGQISEHIPKKGVNGIAWQENPDPVLWFTLDNGWLGGYTHQPTQEVRGMHRHKTALWGYFESVCVTPGSPEPVEGSGGQNDDVWLVVAREIGDVTRRYIELLTAPFEENRVGFGDNDVMLVDGDIGLDIMDCFAVDSGLTYEGAATGTVTGLSHLESEVVSVLADNRVYLNLTVSGGSVTLPGGAVAAKWHVGLHYAGTVETLELDVGGRDGSLLGRRKKVSAVILSLIDTDTSGLFIRSMQRGAWETVRIPSNVAPDGTVSLFTGNIKVLVDDSYEGRGKIQLAHTAPTPCSIRGATLVFDAEP